MLMHPSPPRREEELAEYMEMWQDKMRRLEAHGEEFELAPLFKISASRMLMTGKAKKYFDLWGRITTPPARRRRTRSCSTRSGVCEET